MWIYKKFCIKKHSILCLDIQNPLETMKKLKGIFKPLHIYFKCSRVSSYPAYYYGELAPIHIISSDVDWKDKWNTPRFEGPPYIIISLFGCRFIWYWSFDREVSGENEDYWEQALWYLNYYRNDSYGRLDAPDINKARDSWPWQDYETKLSTWNDKYLINGNSEGSN